MIFSRARGLGLVFLAALAAAAVFAASVSGVAAKSVTVGQLVSPNFDCGSLFPGLTFLQAGVAGGRSYTVPKAGVIGSWSFEDASVTVPDLMLKVGRSAGGASYKIVGEATAGTQTPNAINTYPAHIKVKAGDLIGIYQGGGDCFRTTGLAMDMVASAAGNVSLGTTTLFTPVSSPVRSPVSVRVSEDCVVPHLKGKTLKAAKKALPQASCTLGTVRPRGQTTGSVKRQRPAAGTVLAPRPK